MTIDKSLYVAPSGKKNILLASETAASARTYKVELQTTVKLYGRAMHNWLTSLDMIAGLERFNFKKNLNKYYEIIKTEI